MISDCQFLAHGNSEPSTETVVINSLNGTTHVFRLSTFEVNQPAYAGTTDQGRRTEVKKIQNLVAACTFRHKQVISSVMDGGKRLLNQISGGLSYEPQGEVRLVSHVFSLRSDPSTSVPSKASGVARVLTYTSKNELVSFEVLSEPKSATSPRKSAVDEPSSIEE